ncbi:MAG: Gfo/Idh/MocA family oxidoreductase [Gemmataceae bacterium]
MRPTEDLFGAVVGTGFIGPVHIEALRRLGRPMLALVGSSPQRGKEMAQRLNLTRCYDSYEALLEDPLIHVVHLTTPNHLHYLQCRQALLAGKHVLCEKPLAITSAESAQLKTLAQRVPLATGVCYNVRYYPMNQEARQRVLQGDLGKIYHITGAYHQDWLLHETDFNWRVLSREAGPLRAVADIGTHWLDLVQFVTGLEVQSVCADLATFLPTRRRPVGSTETFATKLGVQEATEVVEIDTEDHGAILLRFRGGATGSFSVSQVTAGRKNQIRYEIAGSRTALAWDSDRANDLWLGHRDQPNQLLTRDPSLLSPRARQTTSYPGGHDEGFSDTFKQLFRDFYGFIEQGDLQAPPPFPTFADGHREVVLCEAILKSHRERRWIDVEL